MLLLTICCLAVTICSIAAGTCDPNIKEAADFAHDMYCAQYIALTEQQGAELFKCFAKRGYKMDEAVKFCANQPKSAPKLSHDSIADSVCGKDNEASKEEACCIMSYEIRESGNSIIHYIDTSRACLDEQPGRRMM